MTTEPRPFELAIVGGIRLRTLVLVRWIAIAGQLATVAVVTLGLGIEVPLAPGRTNTGAAIIVIPGGGHKILWIGPEGHDFVPYFARHDITTIILRHRLRVDGYDAKIDAVNDAFQAVRVVRAHAAQWKLDPAKIGLVGFSAGAELSAPFFRRFHGGQSSGDRSVGPSLRAP